MTDIVVRRFIPVPREQVFAAWLDPSSQVQWMLPPTVTSATVESDPRVGGRFRIVMARGGGVEVEHVGEYLKIEPPSLLSFTWTSKETYGQTTVVTIEFHERDGGTELILTHRGLPPEKSTAHEQGWGGIALKLDEFFES